MEQKCSALILKTEFCENSGTCFYQRQIVGMSLNNTTREANFLLFPMYSKAQLNIFGLM